MKESKARIYFGEKRCAHANSLLMPLMRLRDSSNCYFQRAMWLASRLKDADDRGDWFVLAEERTVTNLQQLGRERLVEGMSFTTSSKFAFTSPRCGSSLGSNDGEGATIPPCSKWPRFFP